MPIQEKACWLALFANPEIDRPLAKQAVYHWAIEEQRPLKALIGLEAAALREHLPLLSQEQALRWQASLQHLDPYLASLTALQAQGIDIITRADAAYPENLATRLPERWLPYVLYYRGNLALLGSPAIHIGGGSSPPQEALHLVNEMIPELATNALVLLGGYNQGIDRHALTTGSQVGAYTALVLPLGFNHAQPILKAGQRDIEQGRRLEISPFEPNTPYAPSLGHARSLLMTAMAEALVLIAPEQSPAAWPAIEPFKHDGGLLLIWRGSDMAIRTAWEAIGATPFSDAPSAVALLGAHFQLTEETLLEEAPPKAEETPPVHFSDAESAIARLSRTGRVPEKLAQRLREAEKRGWLGKD